MDLPSLTISAAGDLLRRGAVSPVALAEATLERIAELQPRLHAFVTVTADYALDRARQAEREMREGHHRGPLHGVPFTLKEVIATRGVRTIFGDAERTEYVPTQDSTIHALLEEAGAVLVGKVVSEVGQSHDKPVSSRNAWNTDMSPGTSSSGSGSAVAASLGLFSIGTDTAGSVRHPASNSNLVGLKPTFGRISRMGVWPVSWSVDTAGPLTRTVTDNAIVLGVLGAYDPADPASIVEPARDYRAGLDAGVDGVTIGVPTDDWVWRDRLTEEEETIVRRALSVLADLGATVREIELPRSAEARASAVPTLSEPPALNPDPAAAEHAGAWRYALESTRQAISDSFDDYLEAVRRRAFIKQEVEATLREVDVIATPTGSSFGDRWNAKTATIRGQVVQARSRGTYRNLLAAVCGHPALSVPCGFGLGGVFPVGLMLHGRANDEALLYRVAYAYEQATQWHKMAPPL